jgi:hypothetical protein
MEYTFYKIYSNSDNLKEFTYWILDEGGMRQFGEEKFNWWLTQKGNPEIIIQSGSNEIDIIDGLPILNLDNIKANRKNMVRMQAVYYDTKQGFPVACDSLNYLQTLVLYSEKNSITEIPLKDYDGKIHVVTISDIQSIIEQLIAYGLLLNQIQMKLEKEIDGCKDYEAVKAVVPLAVDNTKELEEQISDVVADVAASTGIVEKPILEIENTK